MAGLKGDMDQWAKTARELQVLSVLRLLEDVSPHPPRDFCMSSVNALASTQGFLNVVDNCPSSSLLHRLSGHRAAGRRASVSQIRASVSQSRAGASQVVNALQLQLEPAAGGQGAAAAAAAGSQAGGGGGSVGPVDESGESQSQDDDAGFSFGLSQDQVSAWPTAAIPMDSSYCSCKRTRVRTQSASEPQDAAGSSSCPRNNLLRLIK